jgi:hypothetical protein
MERPQASPSLIAVDNIGDNRHNQLLQLSIFLTASAASQTSSRGQIDQKPALTEQCRESDSCDIPLDLVGQGPRRPSRALDALPRRPGDHKGRPSIILTP